MIRDPSKLREFEKRLIAAEPADVERNLRLADDLYDHARALGKLAFTE